MTLRSAVLLASMLLSTPAWCVLSVSISVINNAACGQAQGRMAAYGNGGAGGYTYLWSNGGTGNGTSSMLEDLVPGSYTVTCTDQLGAQATASATITDQGAYEPIFPVASMSYCDFAEPYAVFPKDLGPGFIPRTEPMNFYDAFVENQFEGLQDPLGCGQDWWVLDLTGLPPGSYVIHYSDGGGCLGEFTWVIGEPVELPTIVVSGVLPSCSNGAIGAATVQVGGEPNQNDLMLWLRDALGNYVGAQCGIPLGGGVPFQQTFNDLAPGDYWLSLTADEFNVFDTPMSCSDSLMFTVQDLGPVCGSVIGTSWYDVNEDCIQDVDEVGIPYSILLIEPGSQVVLTGTDGSYGFTLLNGSYTLEQNDATLVPICPTIQPVPFTLNSDVSIIDLANGSTEPLDLAVFSSSGGARPGFEHDFYATFRNLSPQPSGPVTITVTVDPLLPILSTSPTPTSTVGNVVTWDLPALGSFGERSIHIGTMVPVPTPLGTVLSHTVVVSNSLTESTLSNNSDVLNVTVVGSFDPNDKIARTRTRASEELYFIDQDDYIAYTIRFQNTGTAEALFVVVTDTLRAELDMLSFEQGVASHAFNVSFKPGRVVEWRFDNINLPDSNANEAASHGLVNFRIKPVLPLLPGTTIENTANIFFDFNPPVITEPSVLVAEFSIGVAEQTAVPDMVLMPNPTDGMLWVQMGGASTTGNLRLLAMDGRSVLKQRTFGDRTALDLVLLHAGPYLLEYTDDNGTRVVRPFIRN